MSPVRGRRAAATAPGLPDRAPTPVTEAQAKGALLM
jgi:hypothetical protein